MSKLPIDDDTLCYRSELEAEFAERLSTDIHTCHAQCQRVLCVAVRKAVAAECERVTALVAARCAEIAYEAEPFHSADLIRKAFGVDK